MNKTSALYFCVPFHDMQMILLPGWDSSSPLAQLLWKWSRCFSLTKYDVRRTSPPYNVQLKTGKPFKGYVPRRTPAAIQAIKEEVVKMQQADLIRESISPYLAPMVVVPKPDGALRVCIDFRQVNLDIVNDVYPMHRIEDQLEAMAGSKVFTTLDLTKGYHQLLLHEDSKEVTAFATPEGLYQWKVLPLGMKTAGAVFQRVMYQIMEGLKPDA